MHDNGESWQTEAFANPAAAELLQRNCKELELSRDKLLMYETRDIDNDAAAAAADEAGNDDADVVELLLMMVVFVFLVGLESLGGDCFAFFWS